MVVRGSNISKRVTQARISTSVLTVTMGVTTFQTWTTMSIQCMKRNPCLAINVTSLLHGECYYTVTWGKYMAITNARNQTLKLPQQLINVKNVVIEHRIKATWKCIWEKFIRIWIFLVINVNSPQQPSGNWNTMLKVYIKELNIIVIIVNTRQWGLRLFISMSKEFINPK